MEIPWTHIIWLTVAVSVYLFGIWEGRGKVEDFTWKGLLDPIYGLVNPMLKQIPALLTPDALHALASMGHGDRLAIVAVPGR